MGSAAIEAVNIDKPEVEETCRDNQKYSNIILKPFTYVHSLKQKNFRAKVALCFNHWLQVPEERMENILNLAAILHSASLVIDDIEDGSDLRRGSPAAHKVYGIPFSINSGNYAYFVVLEGLLKYRNMKVIDIYMEQMLEVHEGQGMDLYWRDIATGIEDIPSVEEYETVLVKKTSAPFQMLIQSIIALEKPDETRDFRKLLNLLGLSYQVRDDYINLESKTYEDTKGFCEDITEGKYSYPILHALKNGSEKQRERLFEILNLHTLDMDLKREALKIIRDIGSTEFAKNRFLELVAEIRGEIRDFGGNPYLEHFLENHFKIDV